MTPTVTCCTVVVVVDVDVVVVVVVILEGVQRISFRFFYSYFLVVFYHGSARGESL